MSLQVWLPLTNDINNYGLSEVSTTSKSSASISTGGKLGNCLTLSSDGQAVSLNSYMNICSTYSTYSMCAWVLMNSTATNHSSSILSSGDWNSGTGQCCFGFYNYSSGYTKLLVPNRTRWSEGINLSTPAKLSTWYHVCITYDGSTTRAYINGSYVGAYSGGGITSSSNNNNLYVGCATYYSGFTLKGKINDLRIYDHCLSSKEIKEISKGLICHYKLNGKGFGNPNLINTNNPLRAGGRTVVTDKKLIISAIDTTADTYFTINLAEAIQSDVEYTLSCDVENMNCSTDWNFPLFAQGNPISKTLVISPSTSKANITFTVPTGSSYVGTTTIFMDDAGRPKTNPNNITLSNFKLEKGSKVTQWCPHTSDSSYISLGLDSTIEFDDSGYKYNGTLSEAIPLASDSPRYGECYYFNSTSKRITLPAISMTGLANSFSISWWGKAPSYSSLMYWGFSNGNRLNYYDGKYCNTGDGGSNPYYKPNTTTTIDVPSVNVWHHFVMVGDGSTNKLYMDGALYGVASTYKGITGSSIVINGWDSSTNYKTNGYISDFRIYATALSADDVKDLYSISASIDKSGNIYAYEFREE